MLEEVIAESYETAVYEIRPWPSTSNESRPVLSCGTVYFSVEGFLGGESVDEILSYSVTILMKAAEQYYPMARGLLCSRNKFYV